MEWKIIVLLASGGTLFAIGGTGFKWARRFVLPAIYAGIAFTVGVNLLTCIGLFAVTVIVNCLPYGDQTSTPVQWVVLIALNSPSLVINWMSAPLVLVASGLSVGLFQASKKIDFISHKVWEFWAGLLQASVIATSLLMR